MIFLGTICAALVILVMWLLTDCNQGACERDYARRQADKFATECGKLRDSIEESLSDAESTGKVNDELRGELAQQREEIDTLRKSARIAGEISEELRVERDRLRELLGEIAAMAGQAGGESVPADAGSSAGGWVSVEERLPGIGANVLMAGTTEWCDGDVHSGHYATGDGFVPDSGDEIEVAHWMPLPYPPGRDGSGVGGGLGGGGRGVDDSSADPESVRDLPDHVDAGAGLAAQPAMDGVAADAGRLG